MGAEKMGQQDVLKILNKLKPGKRVGSKEIAEMLKCSKASVGVILRKLRIHGAVNYEKVSKGKYIYWRKENGE